MIKLKKRSQDNKSHRYYLLTKAKGVSPEYLGLQVVYGLKGGRAVTLFYWFKAQTLPSGRTISARTLRRRKVRDLVLRRLRNGYEVVRKCDAWGRAAVDRSLQRNDQPVLVRHLPRRVKPKTWEQHQLSFDFH